VEARRGLHLIELLVVIIIGILSAIAVPVFLSQLAKAVDAGIKSDLRTVATQLERHQSGHGIYPMTLEGGHLVEVSFVGDEPTRLIGADVVLVHFRAASAPTA